MPPPPRSPNFKFDHIHLESHALWRITGAYWRGRRQLRQFAQEMWQLDESAWRRLKQRHGKWMRDHGVEWRKKKNDDGTEVELVVPIWPSLKVAHLDQFRANLKKLAPLAVRAAELARDPARLRLRYFKLSCVRASLSASWCLPPHALMLDVEARRPPRPCRPGHLV